MPWLKGYWGRQFARPHGLGGKIATFVMNRMNTAMYDAVYENISEGGHILDIGFGNGFTLEQLLKIFNGTFYGIDISGDMIRSATKRNRKAIQSGRLTLAEGSADAIPFTQEFDCIYTVNTIYFWPDLDAGFREIRAKLITGGIFLNVFYTKEMLDKLRSADRGYNKYTPEELKKAAEDNGFTAEIIPITEGRSYVVRAVK
ncbi:MAG: class I SAM-dependent methyltransferase [Methanomassiliicoccaceae archaeon]|jgi:SAM-dependent methyltransferase|nr:class I SAM-dependent methyltransferase [Methanomassiliicoccaceae archaeon]